LIIAYLLAQYPKTSHTFVRREIVALERLGFTVRRYATRSLNEVLVDPDDIAEERITRVLLDTGPWALLGHTLLLALRRPWRWLDGLLQGFRMGWHSDRGLLPYLAYFCEACTLVRWMERDGVQHLHAHFATNATSIARLARRLGGPPYSFTVHGPHDLTSAPLLSMEEKVHEAKFAVGISHYARAQVLRFSRPEDSSKIQVVRCGLDSAYLDQVYVPPPRAPRLICVARFDPEKGHGVLLEAAARLVRGGVAFQLDLIGDGRLRPEIERSIQRLGLADHVVLSGWLGSAQVRDRLLSSSLFVLPSFAEGLPVVLMEALAMCRPVIATYVAGIPELVVDDLELALRKALLATEEERGKMGRRGRERALRLHNVDTEAKKLAELFRSAPAP
jgi:glycosyltransferase involved in cell wall biosynthesis